MDQEVVTVVDQHMPWHNDPQQRQVPPAGWVPPGGYYPPSAPAPQPPAKKTTVLGAVSCGLALLGFFVVPLLFGTAAVVAGAIDMSHAPASVRKQTAGAVGVVVGVLDLLIGLFLLSQVA